MTTRFAERSTFDWALAKCAGATDFMHPERGEVAQVKEARKICAGCPIKWPCLEIAIRRNEQYGVWGEMSPKERRKLRKRVLAGEVTLDETGIHPVIRG